MTLRVRAVLAAAAAVLFVVIAIAVWAPVGLDLEVRVSETSDQTVTAQCRPVGETGFPAGSGDVPALSDQSLDLLGGSWSGEQEEDWDATCENLRLGRLLLVGALAVPLTVLCTLAVLPPWRRTPA